MTITAHGLLHFEYFKQLRMTNTMTKFIQGIITFFIILLKFQDGRLQSQNLRTL